MLCDRKQSVFLFPCLSVFLFHYASSNNANSSGLKWDKKRTTNNVQGIEILFCQGKVNCLLFLHSHYKHTYLGVITDLAEETALCYIQGHLMNLLLNKHAYPGFVSLEKKSIEGAMIAIYKILNGVDGNTFYLSNNTKPQGYISSEVRNTVPPR